MFHLNQENHKYHPKHSSGFTLAEMIIVLAILSIMTTIGIQTFIAERDRFEFNNALVKTMQLVKTVRTYSTTSYPVYSGGKNIVPSEGYGIQVNLDPVRGQSTLKLFANTGTDPNQWDAGDVSLETYTLPKQIIFKYFWFKKDGGTDTKMWKAATTNPPIEPAGPTATVATLIFKPPLGNMLITDSQVPPLPLEQMSLQFENPASDATGPKKCQKIIINRVREFPEITYSPSC